MVGEKIPDWYNCFVDGEKDLFQQTGEMDSAVVRSLPRAHCLILAMNGCLLFFLFVKLTSLYIIHECLIQTLSIVRCSHVIRE